MDVFAAIADPVRRSIVLTLSNGPMTAGAIARAFPHISRPAVSRHLRVLREAHLVTPEGSDTGDGRERHYKLNPVALQPITEWIDTASATRWKQQLDALETEVARTRRDRRTTKRTVTPKRSTT